MDVDVWELYKTAERRRVAGESCRKPQAVELRTKTKKNSGENKSDVTMSKRETRRNQLKNTVCNGVVIQQ